MAVDALNAAAFFLVVSYLAYVTLIVVPFLRRKPAVAGDGAEFDWHFIVPCLNEESVVGETVRRLVAQFPLAHVWCIDDDSDDATPLVLSRLAAEHERVHVVTRRPPEAQQGKGPALNAGWAAIVGHLPVTVNAERVVVGVVDADGYLDPRCLDVIAGSQLLGDPTVSGIQIKVRVVDRGGRTATGEPLSRFSRLLVKLQDSEFTGVIAAQQTLRRHLGSVGMGGNGQFTRLSSLNRIADEYGTPWHGSLLEDFELGLHILLTGSRTQYCHDTWVEQEGLPRLGPLVRQRSRWAQGSMQCFRYLLPVLRSPRISTPGAVEIAYFLALPWIQLAGTMLYVATAAMFSYYALSTPGGPTAWLDAGAWGIIPLFVLFGIGPLVLWGPIYRATTDRSLSRAKAVAFGFANWPYTAVHYVATWRALSRVLRARHDWVKTERIAPAPVALHAFAVPELAVPAAPAGFLLPAIANRSFTVPALAGPRPTAAHALAPTPTPVPASVANVAVGTFNLARPGRRTHVPFPRSTAVGTFRPRTTGSHRSDHRRIQTHEAA